jgi:NCAIR mutase (PurE)-related protein
LVIEFDEGALSELGPVGRLSLIAEARTHFPELEGMNIDVQVYVRGSAFVGTQGIRSSRPGSEFKLDFGRPLRLGLSEAIFCAQKSAAQMDNILCEAETNDASFLLTRLDPEKFQALGAEHRQAMDYDPASRTGFYRFSPTRPKAPQGTPQVVVVTAGTSDADVAREAVRTLEFNNIAATTIFDVGVAGLWRLMERIEEIRRHPVVIAVAGMDAALPSVLGGLVPGALIAVPTSTGYGVAREGETALNACLASCAPGITVCNIDNGYGAACAAMRVLAASRMVAEPVQAAAGETES